MLSENLQIYKDTKQLCMMLMKQQGNVPRSLRYGEYAVCISLAFRALDAIYRCNADKERRAELLDGLLCLVGGVRDRVQVFAEVGQLQLKPATNLVYVAEKVLRQAHGWRNASRSPPAR